MITTAVVFFALFFLSVVTLLSIFEMSLSRISKVTVRRLVEKHKSKRLQQLKALADNRLEGLISVYVGIQVCMVGFAILTTGYLHNRLQSYATALPAAFGIMFAVVVVFRQLIPRLFTFRKPERVLLPLVPVYNLLKPVLGVLAYPLSSTLRLFSQLNSQDELEKTDEHIEEEIQAFIDVGKEEGILEKDQAPLVQSAVEFGDKLAGDIMTPRTEIVAIEISSSLTQLKQLMTQTKYSRIPVYREHLESIAGMVYLKDVLDIWDRPHQTTGKPMGLENLIRPVQFVPETKRVAELLTELQHQASHVAMVIDEYGGLAGLVTVEDILEEIAGEIHDEDEIGEMLQITQDAQGHYIIPGGIAIERVEEVLGINLNREENTTIAGFVNSAFGRVPRKGERYEHQGVLFEIKEADRRKIYKLSAMRVAPAPEGSAEMRASN
ncbi:MAG: hemolysin family protein [Acidobacteriales bacterium]|nr:hemolysin family protein [Terriglobales bacterium]MCI0419001.1 hemolysin family protein [Acidobacteriota bacterium]MCI0628201.1 hemolysin family protein [Acidobacteriota bacterium]MCI0718675.1 hemolysin family protein [Acidobacteriota bacterium]